jgi:hypothetical protein
MAESNMNISMSYDSIPSDSINWKKFNGAFSSSYTIKVNSICDKAVSCTDWWCIYDNCISPSRPKPYIIRIAMPEIRVIPYFLPFLD